MLDSSIKLLKFLPPELAHTITINALKYFNINFNNIDDQILSQRLIGLDFPNPIGLAAGFDKNAEVVKSMFSLGFGYVEVGTVTPLPQKGNPKPRIFRLEKDNAIINSLGFNWENLSITALNPKSDEQEDHTAPILADARKAIIVSAIFGKYPTITSPFLIFKER